jgi:putative transposase
MNRGNCRMRIFNKPADYLAFLTLMEEGRRRTGMRILGYCLLPNHWHIVLWPKHDGDLSAFVGWISSTHVRRWREHRRSVGEGHLYQGRFKNFPVQPGPSLYKVLRYVEGNARRAKLAANAQDWPYSSIYTGQRLPEHQVELTPSPSPRPADWLARINEAIAADELEQFELHIRRGRPLGTMQWTQAATKRLGLEQTMRNRGRPPKAKAK